MTDIVERLRAEPHRVPSGLALEAAEEIEMLRRVENDAAEWVDEKTKRLRAENERLRAALREIVDAHDSIEEEEVSAAMNDRTVSTAPHVRFIRSVDIARRTLDAK